MTQTAKQVQNKQERIEQLIERIIIERDGTGLYAVVPSLTSNKKYFIDINPRTLEIGPCQCIGTQKGCDHCQHVIAAGVIVAASRIALLERVCDAYAHGTVLALEGISLEAAVDEAECLLSEMPDEAAAIESDMDEEAQRARFAEWKANELIGNFYEVRFSNVCGHRVKQNVNQSCGCDA